MTWRCETEFGVQSIFAIPLPAKYFGCVTENLYDLLTLTLTCSWTSIWTWTWLCDRDSWSDSWSGFFRDCGCESDSWSDCENATENEI